MATILLDGATAAGAGAAVHVRSATPNYVVHSFQAVGAMSAATGTTVVNIEVSNDGTNYLTLGTISLTLSTTPANDGFACMNTWEYVRANVVSITTNGTVTVYMKA